MWPGRSGFRFTSAKEWGVVWKTCMRLSTVMSLLRVLVGWRVYLRCHIERAKVDHSAWEGRHFRLLRSRAHRLIWVVCLHFDIVKEIWNI